MVPVRQEAVALRDYRKGYISNQVVECPAWLENLASPFNNAILLPWIGIEMIPYDEADLNGQLLGIPGNLTSS